MTITCQHLRRFLVASIVSAACGAIVDGQTFTRPAPTAADWAALSRLPDFTGVWELGRDPAPQRGPAAARGDARGGAPDAASGAARGGRGAAAGRGRGQQGGPSFTPEYAAKRAAYLANPPEDNETANCLPAGMPGIMGQPYPMEFLLTPGQVTIVIEAYTQVRHIYTDGRSLPDDPDPTFHGTSVGRWEGDTLVVTTVGFSPLTQLERGVPHGDKMRIVERLRLTDPETMSIETTVSDPDALTSPYTSSRTLKRHRNWTIAEYICEENNRNFVDSSGKAGVRLGIPGAAPATQK